MNAGDSSVRFGTKNYIKPYLLQLADVIESFGAPDRQLDARIAAAVFPALSSLPRIDEAVWQHADGSRVRALRYTFAIEAAMTLIPSGHWLEQDTGLPGRFWVYGSGAGDNVSATNSLPALAVSAAALRAIQRMRSHGDG
jgi:hypothetical protein